MNQEHVKAQINQALDLLQLITEDLEENFFGTGLDNAVKARASMTVSALYILGDYLRNIRKEATV